MFCEGAMADWSGVFFREVVHAPGELATTGYIAFTSTMALGRFISDRLVTKYGATKILRLSGILIAVGLATAIAIPGIIAATTGFLVVGFGVSSVIPIAFGLAARSKTMLPSTALATVSSISFLGFLAGPPLIGFIAQATSLKISFALVAALGLGTTLLSSRVKTSNS
jgi:MFS family permease